MTASLQVAVNHNRGDAHVLGGHLNGQTLPAIVRVPIPSRSRGRPPKFTPERMQQVINLVERGRTREEIAEIIGVTTGTLQVTCSKLGISLRRPTFNTGTGLLRLRRPAQKLSSASQPAVPPKNVAAEPAAGSRQEREPKPMQEPKPMPEASKDAPVATFAIRIEYKGEARSTRLPLDQEMIRQLAMEAEFRGMRMGELVTALILGVTEKDLFCQVLANTPEQRVDLGAEPLYVGR